MPVRARMPSKRFYQAWLAGNPDLTCVQRGCDLRVEAVLTASYLYAFDVVHNGDTFSVRGNYGDLLVSQEDAAVQFVERLGETLARARHKGDSDPADEFLIERG